MADYRSSFQDKRVLITGAGAGIGAGLVTALAEAGALVWATDKDPAALARWDDEGGVRTAVLDVTNADAFCAVVATAVEADGPLDMLINNAGVGLAGLTQDCTLSDWHRVINVNLWGVIHGTQAVLNDMVTKGSGHIVNIASPAGLCPRPGMTAYATAKHAVVGMSASLGLELCGSGVSVSCVAPSFVATEIFENTTYRGVDGAALLAGVPFKPMTAYECATRILKGVRRRQPLILIGIMAHLEWWLHRLSPALLRILLRVRVAKFSAASVAE